MSCEQMRVALSARLDGEDAEVPGRVLDAHLAECGECAEWLDQAQRMTRTVRLQSVEVPDLTAAVLAAVAADPQANRADLAARDRRRILRLAVALSAVAQLMLAVPLLFTGLGLPADAHMSREMASFDVALAVGFGIAAWRPQHARVFTPVALVLAGCLAVTTAVDLASASTALVHEVGHLAVVAQAALLWALGRASGAARGGAPAPVPSA